MGRTYDPSTVPEVGAQLHGGRYLFRIALDDSERTSNGKYQIKGTFRVVEPKQHEGLPHFENFVVGSDTDPEAEEGDTWKKSFAAGRYRQMLEKCGVGMSGDIETDIAGAEDQTVGGLVTQTVEPATDKQGQPNPYAGTIRSRISTFFAPGERETGVDVPTDGVSATTAARPAAKPAARPVAPVQAPAGRPAPAAPARPAAPAGRPATLATKPTATVPKVQTVKCMVCSDMVPKAELGAHVQQHADEEE